MVILLLIVVGFILYFSVFYFLYTRCNTSQRYLFNKTSKTEDLSNVLRFSQGLQNKSTRV